MRIRTLAILVLASLLFTALAAVATLIFGSFDETAGRILGTSGSVAGYSLLAMAGAASLGAKTSDSRRRLGVFTLACSLVGFASVVLLIWESPLESEPLAKCWGVATVTAAALALVALLERISLPPAWSRLRPITVGLLLALAALIDLPLIIFEESSSGMIRTIGVVGVLAALGLLSMPVLAWQAARERRTQAPTSSPGTLRLVCPGCRQSLEFPLGRSLCPECGQGVEIKLFRDETPA